MRECLGLALRGKGRVSLNPLVGAVIVRRGTVIARGFHRRFGGPHAEIDALAKLGGRAPGATLYVNLEPCAHYGKTPPCTESIIASGISSVVVAMRDPNPLVAGRGIRALKRAGIGVTVGVLEEEARELNRIFLKHITRRVPYVHVKIAQSIDGYIAGPKAPRYLTSGASLRTVHRWRAEHDAVLIGAGTVRADNPHLTVRHVRGHDPHVVIIDGRLSIHEHANALSRDRGRGVFVCVGEQAAARARAKVNRLESRGIVVLRFPAPGGVINLRDILLALYRFSIGSVLVEGGSSIFAQFIRERLADELSIFVAPTMLGVGVPVFGGTTSLRSPFEEGTGFGMEPTGKDVLFSARLRSRR
ncbi:MAG TPA: bifunctional diaminohydroxyphosphoribosylaminopyrimidine deaminase/5-amino-6-(5-phosphoribosylamino)uracil reductase RibD [Bacteroidota bacterium]|nr:bifunctional diaminohydroxyphosphoribosylaminopyrimidine deaminase/5-amino-6-(5-phosphoribosylamino)uracil reductase RibD [Bacteroidota bacterium]